MRYQISPEAMVSDGTLVVRARGSVAMVSLVGRSLREAFAEQIKARLLDVAEKSHGRVALSLAEVKDVTSAGINALIAVNLRCKQLGGALVCFALEPEIVQMLRVTKLDRALAVCANAGQAADRFEEAPRGSWLSRALGRGEAA